MIARIFTISVVSLLLSKARVMAAVITVANTTSTNSIDCGDGQPFCCIEVRKIHKCRKTPVLTCVAKGSVSTGEC